MQGMKFPATPEWDLFLVLPMKVMYLHHKSTVLGEGTCMKDRHLKNLMCMWWNISQMQQASHKKARNKILSHFFWIIY
jgi:hypothetical protein